MLLHRSSSQLETRNKIRQQLDASLKRKGEPSQPYVQQPPYTPAPKPTTKPGQATTTTTTVPYFGPAASPYENPSSDGEKPNAAFEDATVWCGDSDSVKPKVSCTTTTTTVFGATTKAETTTTKASSEANLKDSAKASSEANSKDSAKTTTTKAT